MIRKILSLLLSFSLIITQSVFAQGVAELNIGKYLNQMPAVKTDSFRPAHLRYVSYDLKSNDFKLLLDQGDFKKSPGHQVTRSPEKSENALKNETKNLFNYFLISLSLPNDKFWVNLRPDAPEQIIDPLLEKTDVGKIMLEADLELKKDTAGLTSPKNPEGKEYWDNLYKKAGELFGTENITIPTITRPWIVPGEVIIRESEDSAYIYKANLKVMLEEDYLTGRGGSRTAPTYQQYAFSDPRMKELNKYSTQLIKELILPRLTQEINTSKKYAQLRQVFFSLILSRWFKDRYKGRFSEGGSLLERTVPKIDSGDLTNLTSQDSWSKDYYFNEYKKSFQQGEYSLKEQITTPTGQVIRSYVSGGIEITGTSSSIIKDSFTSRQQRNFKVLLIAAGALFLSYVAISSYSIHLKYQHQQLEENKLDKIKGEIARILEDCKDKLDKGLIDTLTYTLIDSNLAHYNVLDKEQLIEKINNILEDPHVKKTPASWGVCFWLSDIRRKLESSSSPLAPQEGASSAIVLKEEFEKVKQAFLVKLRKLNEQFLLKESNRGIYNKIKSNEKLVETFLENLPFTALIKNKDNFTDFLIGVGVILDRAPESYPEMKDELEQLKQELIAIVTPSKGELEKEIEAHIKQYSGEEDVSFLKGPYNKGKRTMLKMWGAGLSQAPSRAKEEDERFSQLSDAWEAVDDFIHKFSSSSMIPSSPKDVDSLLMPGGIDFTRINYLTRPMGSFQGLDLRLPLLSKAELEGIDINKELASMEQMVNARIDVSTDRLKRLLAAMSQKDAFTSQRETQLLPLLLRLCWLKEEKGAETTPDFRAVLLIADTGLFVEQGNTKHSLN